ncbi:LytTR family DNA-binding domain-containing protein [Bacteroides sp. 224]|uniref:LytR/AlgR family response regulator transcription factor n=1 Tax=Bacteroides sp. 224 TaxID=2302936 RepID=UPI0013D34697|nr:LytTR family DNA-binding domain-containing protein [Bacteroides sp. 224]NDV64315.1 DNA-binding response regulator [Bacteroides sp. 224]
MKINCIVIEDEPLAIKKIEDFIMQVSYLNLLSSFDSALDALCFLKQHSVDLIFLDIRMKSLSGIQLLEAMKQKPKVIITSAYSEYALKGYELEVSDYLLKPFPFDRFLKAVEKVYNEWQMEQKPSAPGFIFVKTEYRIEKVVLKDILYIQGMKDYLQIHCTDKKIMTLQSFKHILQALPEKEFVRVHNSYVVALSQIDSVERNRIYMGDAIIPISTGYKEVLQERLKGYSL